MTVIESPAEMQRTALEFRRSGKTVAFVPTMGCLHEGHLSLMRIARPQADILVASIFVNPLQFGPGEDLDRYPRSGQRDTDLCRQEGVDILFAPTTGGMYGDGHSVFVEEVSLSRGMCGASRPGHFRGVTTVVAKLFNIVQPDLAVFGQKDAQQVAVIRKMVSDLGFPVRIIVGPTVREPDGLAMSSRNVNLSPAQRVEALGLSRSLNLARSLCQAGVRDADSVRRSMLELLAEHSSAKVDYVEIVDANTLSPVTRIEGATLAAVAVWMGKTRLIDNMVILSGDAQEQGDALPPSL